MNREIRVIESGFRASAASLGDWGKSADGLEMRIKALTDQMGVQEKKVSALRSEYERIAAEKGATSKAAQDLEIKLNKEVETLGKMQNELNTSEAALQGMGEESQDAGGKVEDLGKKEEDTAEKTNHLAGVMNGLGAALKAGVVAIAGLAAAVAGVGGAITKLVLDTASYSAELVDLSAKTGISTTRLQELAYVGDQVGTSSETMTSSLARLTRSMGGAQDQFEDYAQGQAKAAAEGKDFTGELGQNAQAFEKLGISILDANGNLRDSEEVFAETIDALGSISNETERDALAMELFGKSAMELNPLIKAGSEEIARLSDEAHKMGAVMAEEDVAAMEAFDDSLSSLQAGLKGTMGTLATAFLPAFQGLADTAKTYLGQFSEIVRGADGDLGKMASGIGDLLGQIATEMASKGPQMLKAGLNILQGVIDGIVQNLPALVEAAVQMVTSLVDFLIANVPMLMQAGIEVILALVNGIVPQLPLLIEMAVQMIVTLITGIAQALPQLMEQAARIIPQVIIALVQALPLLIDAALQLIIALIDGLAIAIPILIEYTPQIVEAIFNALITALPLIGEAAVELVLKLIEGIAGMLPQLGTSAIQLIDTVVTGIKNVIYKIVDVGRNIVTGLWQGIQEKASWLWSQVTAFANNIAQAINDALNIKSPSRVTAEIGKNMALGIGVGFTQAFRDVERSISGAVAGMNYSAPKLAVSGATPAGGGLSMGGIHIYLNGSADPKRVGRAAEQGVLRALKAKGIA